MWKAIKTAWGIGTGFIATYKLYFIISGVVAALGTSYYFVDNYYDMKAGIPALKRSVELWEQSATNKQQALNDCNDRIKVSNAEKLAAIEKSAREVQEAHEIAEAVQAENERLEMKAGEIKFSILEMMRDDEEYADWSYGDVHISTWDRMCEATSSCSGTN